MASLQYKTVTATGIVNDGPCFLHAIVINDTAASNTFLIYDAISATNLVIKLTQAAAGNQLLMFPQPIAFGKGIYYSVTGGTSTVCFLFA